MYHKNNLKPSIFQSFSSSPLGVECGTGSHSGNVEYIDKLYRKETVRTSVLHGVQLKQTTSIQSRGIMVLQQEEIYPGKDYKCKTTRFPCQFPGRRWVSSGWISCWDIFHPRTAAEAYWKKGFEMGCFCFICYGCA